MASLFYFKLEPTLKYRDGKILCAGNILCRLRVGNPALEAILGAVEDRSSIDRDGNFRKRVEFSICEESNTNTGRECWVTRDGELYTIVTSPLARSSADELKTHKGLQIKDEDFAGKNHQLSILRYPSKRLWRLRHPWNHLLQFWDIYPPLYSTTTRGRSRGGCESPAFWPIPTFDWRSKGSGYRSKVDQQVGQ